MGTEIGLLHGFGASAFTWRHLTGPLGLRHRVEVLDRPWASRADQVAATLDQLDRLEMDRPVLIGHSAGAEIAVALALVEPSRVGALVLIAPVIGRRPPRIASAAAGLPGIMRVGPPILRLGVGFLGPVLRSIWVDRSQVTAEVVEGYRRPLRQPGVAESLWEMTRVSALEGPLVVGAGLAGIPCLVIRGERDRWDTTVPGLDRTVVVPDAGHLVHEERPSEVLEEVERFLSTLERPGLSRPDATGNAGAGRPTPPGEPTPDGRSR
jgi:pimeloyl-ACP methyl ester carboxylesterase